MRKNYSSQFRKPTQADLERMQGYMKEYMKTIEMPDYPEIIKFLDDKRAIKRRQRGKRFSLDLR